MRAWLVTTRRAARLARVAWVKGCDADGTRPRRLVDRHFFLCRHYHGPGNRLPCVDRERWRFVGGDCSNDAGVCLDSWLRSRAGAWPVSHDWRLPGELTEAVVAKGAASNDNWNGATVALDTWCIERALAGNPWS